LLNGFSIGFNAKAAKIARKQKELSAKFLLNMPESLLYSVTRISSQQ